MTPQASLKLVGEVRDLQIIDSEGVHCGIADDLEFEGEPGRPLTAPWHIGRPWGL